MPAARRLAPVFLAASACVVTGCGDVLGLRRPAPDPAESPVGGPAKPGQIALPDDGGEWPWPVAPAPAAAPSRPVHFRTGTGEVTSFAVRPSCNRAAVTVVTGGRRPDEPATTRVVWCDTAAGRVLAEWEVPGGWKAWDVSPDGREILAARDGSYARHDTLAVWAAGAGKPPRKEWVPHPGTTDGSAADPVGWAAWAGPGRIASGSRGGQLRVFEAATAEPVATLDGYAGRPTLTPDGTRIAVPVPNGVALIDPATGTAVGTRRLDFLRSPPALAFSPDGRSLAIGGYDRVTVLGLTDGTTRELVYRHTEIHTFADAFGWAGDRHLFADHALYDPACPTPAWEYGGILRTRCVGRQVWAAVADGPKQAALRAFTLPHPGALTRVAAGLGRPGLFHLKQGDGVVIDVSALPPDRREKAAAHLDKRVREAGYRPAAAAAATLRATEDPVGKPETVTYGGHAPITHTARPAELRLVKGTRVLWEDRRATKPPTLFRHYGTEPVADYIRRNYGHPDHELFVAAVIPPQFPGPNAPNGPFGRSDLTAGGVRDRD